MAIEGTRSRNARSDDVGTRATNDGLRRRLQPLRRATQTRVSLEVVGKVVPGVVIKLGRFMDALKEHAWGGDSLELLVGFRVGQLRPMLEQYMDPPQLEIWTRGEASRSAVTTAAISFKSKDGRYAAAVPYTLNHAAVLNLAGHEAVEAALARRRDDVRDLPPSNTPAAAAYVLWKEYVVERTRRQLMNDLDLGYSSVDNGFVESQVDDLESLFAELFSQARREGAIPQRYAQEWFDIARVYVMSRGRADEGSPADLGSLKAFAKRPMIVGSGGEWKALDEALHNAFTRPHDEFPKITADVLAHGWGPVEAIASDIWDARATVVNG